MFMSDLSARIANLPPEMREILAQRLGIKGTDASPQHTIPKRSESDLNPRLSFAQERLWFLEQFEPDSSTYHIYPAYRVRGRLNVATLEQLQSDSIVLRSFFMLLLITFAVLALLLAVVGIYGVMSYAVTQRTQEIGIRMALGAGAGDVLKLILRNGMALTAGGVVIGLAGAFLLTRLLAVLLFGVQPTDALTFAIVSLTLIIAALVACYLPARRAAKVDPLVALRYE